MNIFTDSFGMWLLVLLLVSFLFLFCVVYLTVRYLILCKRGEVSRKDIDDDVFFCWLWEDLNRKRHHD